MRVEGWRVGCRALDEEGLGFGVYRRRRFREWACLRSLLDHAWCLGFRFEVEGSGFREQGLGLGV